MLMLFIVPAILLIAGIYLGEIRMIERARTSYSSPSS